MRMQRCSMRSPGIFGTALLFALVCATLDAGRAVLAAEPLRKSAVLAWWRGVRLMGARPLSSFGSWLAQASAMRLPGSMILRKIRPRVWH